MKGKLDGILQKAQAQYLNRLLPERKGALAAIEDQAQKDGVPIVDPEVGFFLHQVIRLIGAQMVLEVGTAIGYSTVHMARALPPDGLLITIDISRERQDAARESLKEEGLENKVKFLLGAAVEQIPETQGPFDLVFLDAIKEEYKRYVELALPRLRVGGVIVCDNLLWSGQVADKIIKEEERESTEALREFNPWFVNHPQLLAQVLPLGDGTGFAIKTE